MTTWIILNPKAGSGRAERAGLALEAGLPDARLVRTQGPEDAIQLARQARRAGAQTVVPVGGDGTVSQCVTGLCLEEDGSRAQQVPSLALLPSGTGGDFRRTFSFSDSVEQAITRLRSPRPRQVDVGIFQTGLRPPRAFINVLSFGLGGLTDLFVEQGPKWMGGRTVYLWGALRATLVHQPVPIELTLDGDAAMVAPYSNVAVCNGRYFGGGMKICPDADPSDGWLDVVTMELSKAKTLSLTTHIYRGTHLAVVGVEHHRCRKIEAKATRAAQCLIDADGEQLGHLPLRAELLPRALSLLT